ncbi:MAG: diacylglycerol kinase family lipid kinase [Marinoscillum sp.]
MKRNLFIVANPSTRTKRLEFILKELMDFCSARSYKFDVYLTAQSQNAWKTVEKHFSEKYTELVIIGGDGTINEAINGLKFDVPVSIIPNGTGNDFVKMLNIGKTLEDHIQVIRNGVVRKIDLGICNGRKFVNGVGIGFDGQIVADMQNKKSILSGPAKYYYYVLRILATYKTRRFRYNRDKSLRQKDLILLCVANGSTFGGSFKLTPDAELFDNMLDICEIGKISGFSRFMNLRRLHNGSHKALKAVNITQCRHIRVDDNPDLHAHIDGEYFGNPPFDIHILPNALKIKTKA